MKDAHGTEIKIDDIVCYYREDSLYDDCYYLVTGIDHTRDFPIKVWDYSREAPNGWHPDIIRVVSKNSPLFQLILKT